jgi:hypothetical protein
MLERPCRCQVHHQHSPSQISPQIHRAGVSLMPSSAVVVMAVTDLSRRVVTKRLTRARPVVLPKLKLALRKVLVRKVLVSLALRVAA